MGKVIAVIGARLNSSRLPKKQLLDLAGQPLISHIFRRLDAVEGLDGKVLATTADDYNRPLVEWAKANGKAVFAYEGDVNDLVGRVDAVVRQWGAVAVLYVCGDSPLIEPSTITRMIAAWRAKPEAAIAHPEWTLNGKPYIHEGFELFSREAWERVLRDSVTPTLREHVGSSLRPFYAQLQRASFLDDPIFYRLNHRISVDTISDYRFMSEAYRRWYAANPPSSLVSLPWLIEELERDPKLRGTNEKVRQRQVQDVGKSVLIVTQAESSTPDHLGQSIHFARGLQDRLSVGVRLLIEGNDSANADLKLIPHSFCAAEKLEEGLDKCLESEPDWVVWQLLTFPEWARIKIARYLQLDDQEDLEVTQFLGGVTIPNRVFAKKSRLNDQ